MCLQEEVKITSRFQPRPRAQNNIQARQKKVEDLQRRHAKMAKKVAKRRKAVRYMIGTFRFWRFRMAALEVGVSGRVSHHTLLNIETKT